MTLIRKDDTGLAVGRVQQALVEAGYSVPTVENTKQFFGDGTYASVRAFQASHLGPMGKPLGEDGIVGDETWWALQHPGGTVSYTAQGWLYNPNDARDEVRPALDAAYSKIGVREDPDGSNDGAQVRLFTEPGFVRSPWCALFASWAFAQLPGGSPFGRIAGTWALYNWAKDHSLLVPSSVPVLPGDIGVILRGEANDPNHRGHVLPICADLGNGRLATIAGNESNAVRGGIRDRAALSAILRPIPLT
jgi:hypothetical protein